MSVDPYRWQRDRPGDVGDAEPWYLRQQPIAAAQEYSVRLDGLRIHIRDVGHGQPVLLINGLGAHTAMWATMEAALAGLRVISFDSPGAGRSGTPLLPVSIPRLARVATLVLDHVGVDRADVVGYSMGGIVAQQLAADAPNRVRRIVLAASTCGLGAVPGDPLALLNLSLPVRYLSGRLYTRTLGGLVGGRARHDDEWVATLARLRLRHVSLRGYFGQILSLSGWTGLPLLSRIHHPTLVVTGDDDPLVPLSNAMILARRLRRARLLTVRGQGHLVLVDPESPALDPIRRFLAAEQLDQAQVWRDAVRVTDDDLRAATAACIRQAQPWGAIGTLMRRRWAPPERLDADG